MESIVTYLDENFIHYLTEKVEKTISEYSRNPSELADFIRGIRKATDELGRKVVETVLNEMDRQFCASGQRKAELNIKKHDSRKLVTSLGEIRFRHTLFESKSGGAWRYLLDEVIGLDPGQRMSDDAVAAVLEEAVSTSYEKAGQEAGGGDRVSRQAVKNKIHELEFPEPVRPACKRKVPYLYIEADEDHVALQFQAKKGDLKKDEHGRKTNCAIPKIVYVHEGLEREAPKSRRRHLVNARYFGGIYTGDDNKKLWQEVWQYIRDNYDEESLQRIILGADGGTWIRGALDVIPGLEYALDEFHLSKYLLKITAFLGDSTEDAKRELKEAIRENDRKTFDSHIAAILSACTAESGRKRITESADYIRNNWESAGIRLRREKGIVGCSAEGHVSHVFSARMSSRPMGWSLRGADRMSRLRIYVKNGGDLFELAKYQRIKERQKLPEAAGAEGLSCTAVLRSERNPHPGIGKYVEALSARISTEISKQSWVRSLQSYCII